MGINRNNGSKLWEIMEGIIGKIKSVIGTGLAQVQKYMVHT